MVLMTGQEEEPGSQGLRGAALEGLRVQLSQLGAKFIPRLDCSLIGMQKNSKADIFDSSQTTTHSNPFSYCNVCRLLPTPSTHCDRA